LIGRKLQDVPELPAGDATALLPNRLADDETEMDGGNETEDTLVRLPLSPDLHLPVKY
jgi:hypothetical protein